MEKQNSKGVGFPFSQHTAILEHGVKTKTEIQASVLELVSTLKRRELDLCLEVDRACLRQIRALDTESEDEKPDANSQLQFKADLNFLQQLLGSFGHLHWMDDNGMGKTVQIHKKPVIIKNIMPCKTDSSEESEEKESTVSTDSFEVIDSLPAVLNDSYLFWQKCTDKDKMEKEAAARKELDMMMREDNCSDLGPPSEVIRSVLQQVLDPRSERCDISCRQNEWLADKCSAMSSQEQPSKGLVFPSSALNQVEKSSTLSDSGVSSILPETENPTSTNAVQCNPVNAIREGFATYLKKGDSYLWVKRNEVEKGRRSSGLEGWIATDAHKEKPVLSCLGPALSNNRPAFSADGPLKASTNTHREYNEMLKTSAPSLEAWVATAKPLHLLS